MAEPGMTLRRALEKPLQDAARTMPVVVITGARQIGKSNGRQSRTALLLHTGSETEWLAPGILAAPWWRIL